jgi:bcr-type benzoyl-CoA reductase subunit C
VTVLPQQLIDAAAAPHDAAREWKRRTGRPVIGTFPMHFPAEVVHAAGALPVVVQDSPEQITVGHGSLYPFFCGYTRSVVDQATKGQFEFLDAIMFGDHCVQLLSAADVVRVKNPDLHVGFHQLIPALRDNWSFENAERTLRRCIEDIEAQLGVSVQEDDIAASVRLFNENRRLIRELYARRRAGEIALSGREMQMIVKSSMVMDKAEHTARLRELAAGGEPSAGMPVYVSGHMCHAPKPEILDMIEECGARIVDDDLYTGYRFVSLDVEETGDPVKALTAWYIARNDVVPCPTRLDPSIDWDGWLLEKVREAGAQGLIVLLVKFCEPHYFYYPRIKQAFEAAGVPHLLLETEHDMSALGNLRTRIEAFVELLKRKELVA